jgi:hypothetical protein
MSYAGPERRTRRDQFRFSDRRVVVLSESPPTDKVLYDGPDRRADWPENSYGIGARDAKGNQSS